MSTALPPRRISPPTQHAQLRSLLLREPLGRWCRATLTAANFAIAILCFSSAAAVGAEPLLQGVVVDPDGQPLAELKVRLFDPGAPGFTAEQVLAAAATDDKGRFAFDAVPQGGQSEMLLKIIGEQGAGRVIVSAGAAEPLSITYPVRTTIWLLHDNDLHFDFNHLGDFRDEVNRYREQYDNVYLLNAGDIFVRHADRWPEPEPEHYYRRASGMILIMNELGYDVVTPGNHEIHYHGDYTRKALELAEFPLVAANMEIATDKLPQFDDYAILQTDNGYTLAVLGLTTGGADGVTRHDFVETARDHVHLAEEHDLFIAVTHLGIRNERQLAEEVPELDVIVGGHSHTLLEQAELVGGVLVAQAGGSPHHVSPEWPKYLGKIRIELENGRVVEKQGHVKIFGE